ncbi:unnamed protein product [Gordionus sp. m RMFG-2023]
MIIYKFEAESKNLLKDFNSKVNSNNSIMANSYIKKYFNFVKRLIFVFSENTKYYSMMFLLSSFLMANYGSHLTLTTICTPKQLFGYFLYPNDCSNLSSNLEFSIPLSLAISYIIDSSFSALLIVQWMKLTFVRK